MNYRKLLCFLPLIALITSCSVLPKKDAFEATSTKVSLAVLGTKERSFRKTDFETVGIPVLKKPVALNYSVHNFTEELFKKYTNMSSGQPAPVVKYVDSLENKPKFVVLEIMDKVLLLSQLNKDVNRTSRTYIKNRPNTKIITGVRMVLTAEMKTQLKAADALYLTSNKRNKNVVLLYKKERQIGTLSLDNSFAFGYKMASFCWDISEEKQVRLGALVGDGERCSQKMLRDPKKLEERRIQEYLSF